MSVVSRESDTTDPDESRGTSYSVVGTGERYAPLFSEDKGLLLFAGRSFSQELTDYVVTRWYRPPEILISPFCYSKPVDLWYV